MRKNQGKKKGNVSPKKESPRITAFFRVQNNETPHSGRNSFNTTPCGEKSAYFSSCESKETEEIRKSKTPASSKVARLSLMKNKQSSIGVELNDGSSTSSQNSTSSDIGGQLSLATKRKVDSVAGSSSCVTGKKSKTETQIEDSSSLFQEDVNCIRESGDQKEFSTGKHITSDSCSESSTTRGNEKLCIKRYKSNSSKDELAVGHDEYLSVVDNAEIVTVLSNKNINENSGRKTLTSQISDTFNESGDSDENVIATTDEPAKEIKAENAEEDEYRIPYYLENFSTIVNYVMSDEFYNYLFNDDDREIVNVYHNLTENGQKLYVRLFGRQYRWLRKNKIVYPKISEDLTAILEELVNAGLFLDETQLVDLPDILKTLPVPDLKALGKSLRLNTNQLRESLIEAVIKHCAKSNINTFFKVRNSTGNNGTNQAIVQRAKKLLGPCYKLCKSARSVFMRITMLFALHRTNGEEDERGAGQAQLFQMLMSNIGKVKYPEYKVKRSKKIFESRESLQRFSAALQVETEVVDALERKDYQAALECYQKTKEKLTELTINEESMRHDRSLPSFLRVYTAGAVYTRVLSQGVELFQFKKQYSDAVTQLQDLIEQEMYHLDYRGRWYERLVLNLDHHLKKPSDALDSIKAGLADPNIRLGHRYALFQRAQKICHAPSNKKLRKRWKEFSEDVMALVAEAPKVYIQGKRLDHVAPGGYAMFISEDSFNKDKDEVTFLKRVEDVALNYYKEQGYTEGLHAEGGIISLLFNLVMWNIIFCDDIPDIFYNMYQTLPLDLYTEAFYLNRKTAIDQRLKQISEWTEEELCQTLDELWERHYGTMCVGVNWEMFTDVGQLTGLCRCMGVSVLTSVFDRMAKDRRFTRSGVPDLTVWNPQDKSFKIVEVKGPGDRLSTKQILWLDYLVNVGVKAEVCHVQAVGVKKIH